MPEVILLPGLSDASAPDVWILWLKVMAAGASMALSLLLGVLTWSLYRHRDRVAPIALQFTLTNLFATGYVVNDAAVRVAVVLDDAGMATIAYRSALSAIVIALAGYVNLYWALSLRARPHTSQIGVSYTCTLVAVSLLWIDHPALVIADASPVAVGSHIFVQYGHSAPLFFGLCLLLLGIVSYQLLRLAASIEGSTIWHLTLFGFAVFFLSGVHDALRELGIFVLPFDTLALGCALFQTGAFAVMAMHYSRMLNERNSQGRQLRQMADEASRDPLSGLYNRAYLERRLDRLGPNAHGGLLFIDLDHFKTINDRFGHWCGDRLIQAAAQRIRQTMREGDIACRWGGDEFVAFLVGVNTQTAQPLVDRLADALCAMDVEGVTGIDLSASMGFAELNGDHWRDRLNLADQALYEAKRAGRNRLKIA